MWDGWYKFTGEKNVATRGECRLMLARIDGMAGVGNEHSTEYSIPRVDLI